MGSINFISVPLYFFLILGIAYLIKPSLTNSETKKYFIPALLVKFIGALSLGLIYQFYYGGGDTIAAYHGGATQIWNAFLDSPIIAIKLLFAGAEFDSSTFNYSSKIIAYGDLPTYFIVRVAGLFSIFTLNSYYANALLFATVSFTGTWAMFNTFYGLYPNLKNKIAIIVLFVPSTVFWGSGILKDTITFAAVGWFIYAGTKIFISHKSSLWNVFLVVISCLIIIHIKIYIALCLFPSFIVWFFLSRSEKVKNKSLKLVSVPILLAIGGLTAFFIVNYLGSINRLYSIDQFANRAKVTSEWLAYVSIQQGGSYYSLGNDNDFTNLGMVKKFIPAVWTTFFRPYLWEAKNPIMLLSALESFSIFIITIYVFLKNGLLRTVGNIFRQPIVFAFLLYSILFAFAIGVSTYNFGTLVRYKIPMLPFFLMTLLLLHKTESNKPS